MTGLRLVAHGPEAARALRDAVAEAKRGDALAPVTVAVPSNYAGLSLRRRLGSGELPIDGRAGLVNVRFYVLARVAELLGAPSLAASGRRPLTGPLRAEAVRGALRDDPGVFREVAQHTSTERSLQSTFRELRNADEEALSALGGQSARAADVVRLYRRFRQLTAPYYDEEDLARAAAEEVRAGTVALRDIGAVILYLPRRLSPGEQALVEALAAGGLSAIVGVSGDEEADAPSRTLAERLARVCDAAPVEATAPPPNGTHIVAATDAEEEVRAVLRLAMARMEAGTPLYRMALLYPTTQPYALIAHEQFHAAGVPHNGPSVRTLGQTLTGRTLLGLLRLREEDFQREDIADWLNSAPVLEEAHRIAPGHRWDELSREAGIVGGAEQWRERLAAKERTLEARLRYLREQDEDSEARIGRIERDIDRVRRLGAFVRELDELLKTRGLSTWAEFASWAKGLLDRYLGAAHGDWPDDEVEAQRAVNEAIAALGALDQLGGRTDEPTFRRALERELEAPAERIGRFGDGMFVGRIADGYGLDFDAIFVVGMSEGLLPSRGRDDPLLPDRERLAAGDAVPPRKRRQQEERRDYLAALASAGERVLVFPRADLRGQRGKLPARWLIESASALEGRRLFSKDFDAPLTRPWFTAVHSFEAALSGDGTPASQQEYDLRSLLHWRGEGGAPADHYLPRSEAALGAGLAAEEARQSDALTRWDGRVPPAQVPSPSAERSISPTALQTWASCPFHYLLSRVLGIAELDKPEDTLRMTAIERGNLIHAALERFIREAPARVDPEQAWNDEERGLLRRIASELCEDAERSGITGRPLLWKLDRARILRDLEGFLEKDEEVRREHGVVPVAAEFSFGLPGSEEPAARFVVDGRTISFRGRIDRIDRAPKGSHLVVIDYKSGRLRQEHKKLADDPLHRGRLLQLPVYSLAAQARYGARPVAAYYWFVTEEADYALTGYNVEDTQLDRFRGTLTTILGGIDDGLFPARPGEERQGRFENCQICPYDRVCAKDRWRAWERKRRAPELRAYLDLAEP